MAIVDKESIAKELRIDIEKLDCVVLDSTRFLDKKITKAIQKYKEENNVKLTTPEKEQIRRELLGYPTEQKHNILFEITKDDLEQAYKVFIDGYLPINDFLLLQRKSFKNKKAQSFRGGMNCDQIIF